MSRHIELPHHFYINVDNKVLGPNMPAGITKGIWWGIYSRPGQHVMCHVMLESGANWSGLQLESISTKEDFSIENKLLMPWATMGDDLDIFSSKYLEGLTCETIEPIKSLGRHTGIIIDWRDGYSRYPQEHKPLSLINLSSGQFSLLPNNYILYDDPHFIEKSAKQNLKYYKRNEKISWES